MKIIIAGTRTFNDYDLLKREVMRFMSEFFQTVYVGNSIIVGGANGADTLGVKFSKEYELPLDVFQANWGLHGKAAGPIRNEAMAKEADACIVFWDGKSRGSKNMIDNAIKYGLILRVVNYERLRTELEKKEK